MRVPRGRIEAHVPGQPGQLVAVRPLAHCAQDVRAARPKCAHRARTRELRRRDGEHREWHRGTDDKWWVCDSIQPGGHRKHSPQARRVSAPVSAHPAAQPPGDGIVQRVYAPSDPRHGLHPGLREAVGFACDHHGCLCRSVVLSDMWSRENNRAIQP